MVWDKIEVDQEGDNWYRKAIKLMKDVAFLTVGKQLRSRKRKKKWIGELNLQLQKRIGLKCNCLGQIMNRKFNREELSWQKRKRP